MKKCKLFIIILLSWFTIFSVLGMGHKGGKIVRITKEEAIKIANEELLKQNFNVRETNIFIDENNTVWKERYLSNNKFSNNNLDIIEKLRDREYWAINYMPIEENILGGEAWVFVDKNKGEIILLFYLK